MTKKQIAARRQYLADLVKADRANRCPDCLRDLNVTGRITVWGEDRAYCPECAKARHGA